MNEAISGIDALLHPFISREIDTPPADPSMGDAWLVATGATGAWAGHDGELAAWTAGGWRFISATPGMRIFDISLAAFRHFDQHWSAPTVPVGAQGGNIVDAEARQALDDLIARLCNAGIFPAS